MKRLLFLLPILLLASCGGTEQPGGETPPEPTSYDVPTPSFAKGADISWVSEMESMGRTFKKRDGTPADIFDVLKELGINSIRLRVWVNPTGGWSGKDDVVKLATRAAKAGMALMVDFHYSDFFADPSRQDIPKAWEGDKGDLEKMARHVSDHTTEVLKALKEAGVTPAWVQVGNETRNGMLWPAGQLWTSSGDIPNGRANFAKLLTAGYDAVKAVFPKAVVLAHLNNAFEDNAWWFEQIKEAGGKFDAIALSHYPQTEKDRTPDQCNSLAISRIKALISKFNFPVIVAEVGVKTPANEALASQVLSSFMKEIQQVNRCSGVFYWEPEVYGGWKPTVYNSLGWNAYDMGAFTSDGKASSVMDAFK